MVDTPGTGSDAPDEKRAAAETSGTAESPSQASERASEQAAAPTGAPAAPAATPVTPSDAPAAAPAPEQPAPPATTPDTRPRPEFGEYAPEGWEWTPKDDAAKTAAAPNAAAIRPGGPAARAGGSTPANVQGVPHNLGAGTALPSRKGTSQGGSGTPYRAAAPGQPAAPTQPAQYRAPAQGSAAAQQLPARTGDRIVTILLLVLGGFGALQSAFAMMGMSTMFVFLEDAPGITELSPPAWIDLTGKVVGIALLVLYGLVLVYSIRRLRARKLTFWAPLAAGVLSAIVVIAIIAGAMIGTPELMELMRDPQASAELLEYLQGIQAQ